MKDKKIECLQLGSKIAFGRYTIKGGSKMKKFVMFVDNITGEKISFNRVLRMFKGFGWKIFNRNGIKIEIIKCQTLTKKLINLLAKLKVF